jgi:AraC family transcriptional regulator
LEWLTRMSGSMNYIEEHLADEIDVNEAARIAFSSPFHFQRMFHMLTGVTVAEYVRKRRLTLAAQELVTTKEKIIDIALKYGYDTPESFARAFRKVHGINPSAAREPGANLKVNPRLSFQISLKGDQEMNYQIVEKPAFKVMGKGIRVSTENGENIKRIPQFWRQCYEDGYSARLEKMASPKGATGESKLGVCLEFEPELKEFTYFIGVELTQGAPPDDLTEKTIPAATWAIFESIGPMPHAIQNLNQRIYSEWFPSTGYQHAGGIDMEVYPPGDADDENYRCEVWIPITKK